MLHRLLLANAAPAPHGDVMPQTPQPRRRHGVSSVAPDAASSRTMVDVDRINLNLVSCSRDVWGQPTLRRFVATHAIAIDLALECSGSREKLGTGLPTRGGHGAPLWHGCGGRGTDGRGASSGGR